MINILGRYCSCYNNIFNFISVFFPSKVGDKNSDTTLYEYPTHFFQHDEPLIEMATKTGFTVYTSNIHEIVFNIQGKKMGPRNICH